MCRHRPCWPTPDDAQHLIEAGYADRLMVDWWFDRDKDKTIYLLTPALAGCESGEAPAQPEGPCTFLDADGLCQIHDSGLKPSEGQLALCRNRTPERLHEQIARTWDGADAQRLIDQWEAQPPRGRRLLFFTPKGSAHARHGDGMGRPASAT
jgi:hypothetical protein